MRVTALNPPFLPRFSRGQRSPAVTKSGTLYYPIWLSYCVAALEQAGHEVDLIDAPAAGLSLGEVSERIERFSPGLVIVETSTPSIESDVATADSLSVEGRTVLLCGTHPSALPSETVLSGSSFAGAIVGEYEVPSLAAAAALEAGKGLRGIPGLALRCGDSIEYAGPSPVVEDLDSLPFVSGVYARHLDPADYDNPNALHPLVMVMGGRGCPNRCTFCVFPQTLTGRRARLRSSESLADEMEWVAKNMPSVRSVFFEDDTISTDIARLRALAESLVRSSCRLSWSCNMRADVDFETLALCRRAGLRTVCTGFESGDPGILAGMRKGLDPDTMRRFMSDARRAGIRVHGCFLFGSRGETRRTMEATLDFALELDPDTAQFYPLMVYPGTEAYDQAMEDGLLCASSWRDWLTQEGLHSCVVRARDLAPEELVAFCDHARRRFYLRPSYILRKAVQAVLDPVERRRTLKVFRTFRRYLFRGTGVAGRGG